MRVAPGIEVDEPRLTAICDKYGIGELQIFRLRLPRHRPA
jgi:hypothetical protein